MKQGRLFLAVMVVVLGALLAWDIWKDAAHRRNAAQSVPAVQSGSDLPTTAGIPARTGVR